MEVTFLGIIALATLLMALIQVGAILYGLRLALRINKLMERVEHDTKPVVEQLTKVSTDATRFSALAVSQMERLEHTVGDLADRVDQTVTIVQQAIVKPAREGVAVLSAVHAAVRAFRGYRSRRARRRAGEEDDALFIG